MRLLFIGDIVGRPGRDIVTRAVPAMIRTHRLDLVVANAENAAGGSGLTPEIYKDLVAAGVDVITLGDHIYRRREIFPILQREANIVRPANFPDEAVGRAWATATARDGTLVAVVSLLGQLYMKPIDSPFEAANKVLAALPADARVRLVDFHVEATGEAQLLGRYLDGRVSAVLGTHTHVPTADECIFPGGTAFQCDVGMTGPHDSVLGRRIDRVLETRLTANPTAFDVATGDVRMCGSIVEADPATGLATSIERVCIRESELPALEAAAKASTAT